MNPIIPPLKAGDRGDRVAGLQDASDQERRSLTALLQAERRPSAAAILRTREPAQPLNGEATTRAVTLLQQAHQLPATGQVDEPTATARNAAVTMRTIACVPSSENAREPSAISRCMEGQIHP